MNANDRYTMLLRQNVAQNRQFRETLSVLRFCGFDFSAGSQERFERALAEVNKLRAACWAVERMLDQLELPDAPESEAK